MSIVLNNNEVRAFNAADDPKKLRLSEPRSAYGSVFANVCHDKKSLALVLPAMQLAWDPSTYDPASKNAKTTIDLDLKHAQQYGAVEQAYQMMRAIDDRVAALVVENRDKIVPLMKRAGPMARSDEQVKACYQPCTRLRTSTKSDRAWAPRLTCTVTGARFLGGADTATLAKGDVVRCVIQATALCSKAEKVTLSWRVLQIRKQPEGLGYPDQDKTEKEVFGVSLSGEDNGEGGHAAMDLTVDLV